MRPDQWIGGWQEFDPQEALLEVARRYLRTFGPASRDDFAAWWGVPPGKVSPVFKRLMPELEEVVIHGQKLGAAGDRRGDGGVAGGGVVRLLPGFDPDVVSIGAVHKRFVVPPAFPAKISRTAGWIAGGAGRWAHRRRLAARKAARASRRAGRSV